MNIYIGNFSYDTTTEEIQTAFEAYGRVESVKIIRDNATGQSRGFAFVTMLNPAEGKAAMGGITEIKGKKVKINEAQPQKSFGSSGWNRSKNYR